MNSHDELSRPSRRDVWTPLLRPAALLAQLLGACAAKEPDPFPERLTPAEVQSFLFDNNPTGRTIRPTVYNSRLLINDRCVDLSGKKKAELPSAEPFLSYGRMSKYVMQSVIDTTTFKVELWMGEIIPRKFHETTSGGVLECRTIDQIRENDDKLSKITKDWPRTIFTFRHYAFYTDAALFEAKRKSLPRHGGRHIVWSDARCTAHLELAADNSIKLSETIVRVEGKDIGELTSKPFVMCLLRSSLATLGLTGMLTYPEDKLIYEFDQRLSKDGGIMVPFWKLHPFVALRYIRPAGQDWPTVKARVLEDTRK